MRSFIFIAMLLLTGCGQLVFNQTPQPDALLYFEPVTYLYIATSKDCVQTAQVISLPGHARSVTLKPGYGTTDLSVNLSNGMITSVGQKTDPQIPQTITALTGAASTFSKLAIAKSEGGGGCPGGSGLYKIGPDGVPDLTKDYLTKRR